MTKLKDIMDPAQLMQDNKDGYIREVTNPTHPNMHILCYTPMAQFSRHWNDATRNSRGLCVTYENKLADDTADIDAIANANIISRGIPKFFTVSTIADASPNDDNIILSLEDDDEMVAQLSGITVTGRAKTIAADKLDGAMCVGYVSKDDLVPFQVHTKGSFTSDEARVANRILMERYNMELLLRYANTHPDETPIFEVITPQYPHLVNYGNLEDLIFLGTVSKQTGRWTPADDDHPLHTDLGFDIPEIFDVHTLEDALALKPRKGKEGIVLTIETPEGQRMLKVKYEAFLALQRLRAAAKMTTDAILPYLILNNITTPEALESADTKTLIRICDMDPTYSDMVDTTMLKRIAEITIRPLLPEAKRLRPQFTRLQRVIEDVYYTCDISGADNAIYVYVTLTQVDPDDRPYVFAAKKCYLESKRNEMPQVLVKNIVKHL